VYEEDDDDVDLVEGEDVDEEDLVDDDDIIRCESSIGPPFLSSVVALS
jgi:hypothetical protein